MFLDASAIVAILNDEPEAVTFEKAIEASRRKIFVSPVARFEATVSLAAARSRKGNRKTTPEAIALAMRSVDAMLEAVGAQDVPIDSDLCDKAIAAASSFGRVVGHPAELNLGDCFAYAVAKKHREPILFKGNDFGLTDLERALPGASLDRPPTRPRKR